MINTDCIEFFYFTKIILKEKNKKSYDLILCINYKRNKYNK